MKLQNHFALLVILLVVIIISGCTQTDNTSAGTNANSANPQSNPSSIPLFQIGPACGNNRCESGEMTTNCCNDCGCQSGYYCTDNVCKPRCGDGIKTDGETADNCCQDAGCPSGESCQNNKCILLKPKLSANFVQTTESYSATYLKARGEKAGRITVKNSGNDGATGVKVRLTSPDSYFSDSITDFGDIALNGQVTRDINLIFSDSILDITADKEIGIKAQVTFSNSANKQLNDEESFSMRVAGRNYMTWAKPEMISSWVTPTQPTIREFSAKATSGLAAGMDNSDPKIQKIAARWLFETMRSYGIKYVNDAHSSADYIQFPYETLKNKAGDCDDHAILYAAMLESIGMKSFLMLVPGHIFAGYIDSDGYAVPVETTADDFSQARRAGDAEYKQYKDSGKLIFPTDNWRNYPQVNLPESTELGIPFVERKLGNCTTTWNFQLGFYSLFK